MVDGENIKKKKKKKQLLSFCSSSINIKSMVQILYFILASHYVTHSLFGSTRLCSQQGINMFRHCVLGALLLSIMHEFDYVCQQKQMMPQVFIPFDCNRRVNLLNLPYPPITVSLQKETVQQTQRSCLSGSTPALVLRMLQGFIQQDPQTKACH